MLQTHAKLAREMGMDSKNILISDIGQVIELTPNTAKIDGTVPAGPGLCGRLRAWATWAAWCCGTASIWPRTA